MSKLSMIGNGNFSNILNQIHIEILNTGSSCEIVDSVYNNSESMQIDVKVYEMYFMRTSSRCSLTVVSTLFKNGTIKVDAISSGGGVGVIFKLDYGSENRFLKPVETVLLRNGFKKS